MDAHTGRLAATSLLLAILAGCSQPTEPTENASDEPFEPEDEYSYGNLLADSLLLLRDVTIEVLLIVDDVEAERMTKQQGADQIRTIVDFDFEPELAFIGAQDPWPEWVPVYNDVLAAWGASKVASYEHCVRGQTNLCPDPTSEHKAGVKWDEAAFKLNKQLGRPVLTEPLGSIIPCYTGCAYVAVVNNGTEPYYFWADFGANHQQVFNVNVEPRQEQAPNAGKLVPCSRFDGEDVTFHWKVDAVDEPYVTEYDGSLSLPCRNGRDLMTVVAIEALDTLDATWTVSRPCEIFGGYSTCDT